MVSSRMHHEISIVNLLLTHLMVLDLNTFKKFKDLNVVKFSDLDNTMG
jgi:hypothetical protein